MFTITKNTPLQQLSFTAKELANIYKKYNFSQYEKAKRLAKFYIKWGNEFDIIPLLVFAQKIHETGYLSFGGTVPESANNFCGHGATGAKGVYNVFKTEELGVIAHIVHLAWYIFPEHLPHKDEDGDLYCSMKYDPRHFGISHRYNVHTLEDLGGKWAVPGRTYGQRIADIANKIIELKYGEDENGENEYDNFGKELTNYFKKFNRQWQGIVIHHTATPQNTTVESIRRHHINTRKFIDIGYHFLIDYEGKLHYGRSLSLQGAHCPARINNKKINETMIGISCIGNFMHDKFTWEFQKTLTRFLKITMEYYKIKKENVFRDGELRPTACPGTNIIAWLKKWKN